MTSRRRFTVLAIALSAAVVASLAAGESLDGEAGGGADNVVSGVASPSSAEYSDCSPSGPRISFPGGYSVSACFEHEEDGALLRKDALDYGLGSEKSGLLWFFERDNAEILVKVLDGCAINGHRWVFVAPVTTLAFNLRIDEAATGRSWEHRNPRGGGTATTASDVAAFPCSGASAGAASAPAGGGHGSLADGAAGPVSASLPIRAGEAATCVPEAATTLDGGYTVRMCVEYEKDGATAARNLRDYGLESGRSALLYAFERDNAEVLVKVLDGCAINGRRWVFVAPVTTLAFNLSIDPPGGGASWTHGNVAGRTAAARSDLSAFPCGDAPSPEPPGPDPGGPAGPESFRGRIAGFRGDPNDVEVMLMAEGVLRAERPDAAGWFEFEGLAAGGYAVKIHAKGHRTTPARLIDVPVHGEQAPFDLTPIPADPFVYHWEEDQSTAGREYSAAVNRPADVVLEDLGEFRGASADVVDHSSADRLKHRFNMILVDADGGSWTQEHAYRLLETMSDIPQPERYPYDEQNLPPSRWLLTPKYLEGDIEVTRDRAGETVVRLTEAVFVNAERRVARVEGRRGVWFSKRLHHALVRYVTDNGRNEEAYERIFQERYGVTTVVDDYVRLTGNTTGEDAGKFQKFHPREIVALLTAFEEFPSGMHKTQGLDYLVRRLDGLEHPLYPSAGAVAWPTEGYIEFMEKGLRQNIDGMQRLILHEKTHFLWEHVFDQATKDHWIEIGGWHYDPDRDLWQTTKQTEFVSAYAHGENPNEDMAETVSYFVFNPDKLRSRSPAKYEFVRDRIMQGNVYVSRIREDLTFPVYNLYPDYVFPGKVRRVDIRVEGGPREDKRIRIEVELHALDRVLEGASKIETRIFSDAGTWFDLFLYPVEEAGRWTDVGTVLVGEHVLDRSAKAGYWTPNQMVIADPSGNERFARGDDFGWKLYIENAEEDWIPPEYVPRTARLDLGRVTVEGRAVQTIEASWAVKENRAMRPSEACRADLNDEIPTTYSLERRGDFDRPAGRCRVTLPMPEYMPSSTYSLVRIEMIDAASNAATTDFTESAADERPRQVRLVTSRPDTAPPELDLNRIEVEAEPTNPAEPNGETIVRIRFRVRDDISGYLLGAINLRDPQGLTHHLWHYPDGYNSWFPSRDPTNWTTHLFRHVLPPGSTPGIWGIYDMTLRDRARNFVSHDFTEVLRFEVDD